MGVTIGSKRGFATKEALLGLAVLVIAAVILMAIGLSIQRRSSRGLDVQRMRNLYVSLTMYQESAGGEPPPDLSFLDLYQPDPVAYLAVADPYATATGPFPVDGSLPGGKRTSPYRISFAYLWAHRSGLKWEAMFKAPQVGLIADEWTGDISATGGFEAQVSGKVARINMDGSLFVTPDSGGPHALGDDKWLFGDSKALK